MRFLVAAWIGAIIRHIRLSRVVRLAGPGGDWYLKRRYWYTGPLSAAARLAGARCVILSPAAWLARERHVAALSGLPLPEMAAGWLRVPARPGQALALLLQDATRPPFEHLRAIAAAIQALRALHHLELPGQVAHTFSHGDATSANVCYDPASRRAWWFDIETGHDPRRPACWRQADDLRALLGSCGAALAPARLADLVALAAACYPDPPTWRALAGMFAETLRRPDPLHLAQTRLSYGRSVVLARLVARASLAIASHGATVRST